MSEKRVGEESTRKYFRSDRISVSNGKFYFTTREGTLEGPFSSRDEAERELMMFIRKVSGKGIYGSVIQNEPKKD